MRLPAVLSLLLIAACSDASGPSGAEELYNANLQKWRTTGPASYEMVLVRSCACPVPTEQVRIVVRNRAVESRTFVDTDQPVPANRVDEFPDIEGLFALLKDALDGDVYTWNTAYDPTYGYPATLYLDYVGNRLDDNVGYGVTNFTPLATP